MLKIVRGKLHGIFVTGAELDYHGSITLDPIYCEKIKIFPLEFVEIWNKSNGERFSTYVIYGEKNSRCCVLNGAAARKCYKGDELVIAAYRFCNANEIKNETPKILTFHKNNKIKSILQYNVTEKDGWFDFSIDEEPVYDDAELQEEIVI